MSLLTSVASRALGLPPPTTPGVHAERGYQVVIQSCRGTFGSGGEITFSAEAADGRAAAREPRSRSASTSGRPPTGSHAGTGCACRSPAARTLASPATSAPESRWPSGRGWRCPTGHPVAPSHGSPWGRGHMRGPYLSGYWVRGRRDAPPRTSTASTWSCG